MKYYIVSTICQNKVLERSQGEGSLGLTAQAAALNPTLDKWNKMDGWMDEWEHEGFQCFSH